MGHFVLYGKVRNGTPNRADVCHEAAQEWNKVKNKNDTEKVIEDLDPPSTPLMVRLVSSAPKISANAVAQKKAASKIGNDEKKLAELEQIYNISTDAQLRLDIYKKIVDARDNINKNKEKIVTLQRNAKYAQNRPLLLFEYLNLHEHIHDSVESEKEKLERQKWQERQRNQKNEKNDLAKRFVPGHGLKSIKTCVNTLLILDDLPI
ncbi:19307_t:CDS:2 [Gigaspora rosea]|nr:19307_t:CDS:2 [Gigaspora rosea]